jgi:hypothetical protein
MTTAPADLSAALSELRVRWGDAAPRTMSGPMPEVEGALAVAPLQAVVPEAFPAPAPLTGLEPTFRTGFTALDAILGPAGVPRSGSLALAGAGSAGVTTLAHRLAAEAQGAGAIVVWVDLARSFDPVEAVARGVRTDWLAVLVPETLDEGLAMAGDLLASRAIDLLVLDLSLDRAVGRSVGRPTIVARIERLIALARRADALLVVIEPAASGIGDTAHLRLELTRRGWVRLGRDVVGMEAEAVIARNRRGPPGRRAGLRILYAEGSDRDACLLRDPLLDETMTIDEATNPGDATPPPLLASSPAPAGPDTIRSGGPIPLRADRSGRPTMDRRDRRRRQPGGAHSRRTARDGARERPPTRSRGDLPRPSA